MLFGMVFSVFIEAGFSTRDRCLATWSQVCINCSLSWCWINVTPLERSSTTSAPWRSFFDMYWMSSGGRQRFTRKHVPGMQLSCYGLIVKLLTHILQVCMAVEHWQNNLYICRPCSPSLCGLWASPCKQASVSDSTPRVHSNPTLRWQTSICCVCFAE